MSNNIAKLLKFSDENDDFKQHQKREYEDSIMSSSGQEDLRQRKVQFNVKDSDDEEEKI